ncbi:MAG: hypothetical protein WC340_12660 [Kiritimatiellia bacterium]
MRIRENNNPKPTWLRVLLCGLAMLLVQKVDAKTKVWKAKEFGAKADGVESKGVRCQGGWWGKQRSSGPRRMV